jgi:hypothetical protein
MQLLGASYDSREINVPIPQAPDFAHNFKLNNTAHHLLSDLQIRS